MESCLCQSIQYGENGFTIPQNDKIGTYSKIKAETVSADVRMDSKPSITLYVNT